MIAPLSSNYLWLDDDGPAPGRPGLQPRWTSGKKDAVSTAYAASSRVWFTLSHGTLNEIYFPTIDRPQTRDMELLFSDGETFFHEEKRDLKYNFHYIDNESLAVRMVASDPAGRYVVTKEFISDPHHPVVLMSVKISGDKEFLSRLKCYALLAPHLSGGGAGNSARSLNLSGKRCLLAWKDEVSLAFGASCGFLRSSCGFVGVSDGYQDISSHLQMKWKYGQAIDGNIAVMGEIDVAENREFTVAIAFGQGPHAALAAMMQSLSTPFDIHRARFIEQWHRSTSPQELVAMACDGGRLARVSHNVVLAHEDKTYAGAFIASASIPWGSAKSDDDLGGYHLVWTRDMIQTATAMLACRQPDTALRALVYLACTQHTDGGFAQNFWVNGEPYWSGIQLDEVAFPIVLAWRLWKANELRDFDILPFVTRAAGFLVRYAPVTQQERWEENAGYSPSTLAIVISALICAADVCREFGSVELGSFLEVYADWIEAHLDEWTTTFDGVLDSEVKHHYMRIRPPADGEPFHDPEVPPGQIHIGNRGPDEKNAFEARAIVDAGFLELVRYGVRRADDPLIVDSLRVVDKILKVDTPNGPCWRRYNHDGYGQQKDGGPFIGYGQGGAWPILTGERAHYELAAGHDVRPLVKAIESFSSVGGMLPEQVWDFPDLPSRGLYCGCAAGSAQPLVWAHAEYLKLLRSMADGVVFDRISVVAERYALPVDKRSFQSSTEIFRLSRPISAVLQGGVLRIVDSERFQAVWSSDNWQTVNRTDSCQVSQAGSYVDIAAAADATSSIKFTMFWPQDSRWLGRNWEVFINLQPSKQEPAGIRPQS